MKITRRAQVILATTAAAFALAACGQKEESTVGQKLDGAIEQTQSAASDASKDIQAAATEVQKDVQSAAQDMKREGEQAAQSVSDSAAALGINVDTSNAVVSLKGPAPNTQAAERASVLAKAVEGVTDVNNMLIAPVKP
jgi:hyperosmotically inducible periplasmic protein